MDELQPFHGHGKDEPLFQKREAIVLASLIEMVRNNNILKTARGNCRVPLLFPRRLILAAYQAVALIDAALSQRGIVVSRVYCHEYDVENQGS